MMIQNSECRIQDAELRVTQKSNRSMKLNQTYWSNQYQNNQTGWDIGYISTPIKEYIDQLMDKSIKILIPGAGNAYEAAYLHNSGFVNVYVLDFANEPIENLLKKVPDFPKEHIIQEDFFIYKGSYDLIIEQTFFSSILPENREDYVTKIHELLVTNGKLVGLLFNIDFAKRYPPFGGNKNIYKVLFTEKFKLKVLETAYNSIKPRANNELFIIFEKK